MIEILRQLIAQHSRRGVIVDANILLLYFVGMVDPHRITRFDRTSSFSVEDYELLRLLLARFQRLLVTAHILTEVSNLLGQINEPLRTEYFTRLQTEICLLQEQQVESCTAASSNAFIRFGLTDAAIHTLAQNRHLVITVDFALYMFLSSERIAVINFNQLRPFGWDWLRSRNPPPRQV